MTYLYYIYLLLLRVCRREINQPRNFTDIWVYKCLCVRRANRSTNQSTRQSPSLDLSSVCSPLPPCPPSRCQSAFSHFVDSTCLSSLVTKYYTSHIITVLTLFYCYLCEFRQCISILQTFLNSCEVYPTYYGFALLQVLGTGCEPRYGVCSFM